jgi:hypothetical protein
MKPNTPPRIFLALSLLLAAAEGAHAQGTTFTYQGSLKNGGSGVTGAYDLTFGLFATNSGGSAVTTTETNAAVAVAGGLFTTALDFGGVFAGSNYWLEIGVRTNGGASFTTLTPRQPVMPAPYAIFAGNAALAATAEAVAPNAITAAGIQNGTLTANKIAAGQVVKSLNGLVDIVTVSPGQNISLTTSANNIQVSAINNWNLTGNGGTTAGVNFIGTTDNQPLEMKVGGQRALRLEPNASGAPNLIGGGIYNQVDPGIVGVTIGGGGAASYTGSPSTNWASSDFTTISGGMNNIVQSNSAFSSIGGGNNNVIQASSGFASIGGGVNNFIGTNAAFATVGGGYLNQIQASSGHATIAGGNGNLISTNSGQSAIGGGGGNTVQSGSGQSVIGGGGGNTIQTNNNQATIVGGVGNTIQSGSGQSFIGGGGNNTIQTNSSRSIIAGGLFNLMQGANFATFMGGGYNNTVGVGSSSSSLVGGQLNAIQSSCYESFIGAGVYNTIQNNSYYSGITGGDGNTIQPNSISAFIGGGHTNTIQAGCAFSTIGGGAVNTIQPNSFFATIGGGATNTVAGSYATVPGGSGNMALGVTSFAAGQNARALHSGSLVWSDTSSGSSFSSTTSNQFLLRAMGGVGINTTATPEGALSINTNTFLFSHVLYLRGETVPDHNHGLAYCGFTVTNFGPNVLPDGPVLWGFSGGVLGTAGGGNKAVLTWTPTQITTSVPISSPSDRNVKSAFAQINPREMLQRVCDLPVTSWVYTNALNVRHIGPVAQDFYAAFNVGMDDKHIATVDAEGVAFAAIQGLNQKVEEQRAENAQLKRELAELKTMVDKLASAGK